MSKPHLIGLAGKKGVGKDTVASILVKEHGYLAMAFADPVRAALSTIFNTPVEAFTDPATKERLSSFFFDRTPRYLMQTLGTEWGRSMVNQDIWTVLLKRRISAALEQGQHVVVTDIRFNNEARALLGIGAVVVGVTRPGSFYEPDIHSSEQGVELALHSLFLDNKGSIDDLREAVRELVLL